jgi:hypothetical protein
VRRTYMWVVQALPTPSQKIPTQFVVASERGKYHFAELAGPFWPEIESPIRGDVLVHAVPTSAHLAARHTGPKFLGISGRHCNHRTVMGVFGRWPS